ncbi:MAG: IS1 family transposase [Chroococcidiopsidaceae cyanobacterium CP_BM_RX_35]|nr:IS1 family transposase [Chroococcidiopsidaceae cyanobacterium CP_BM_RX_35]
MTVWLPVVCPDCSSDNIIKHGRLVTGKQRYLCQNPDCLRRTFVLNTEQPGRKLEVKQKRPCCKFSGDNPVNYGRCTP